MSLEDPGLIDWTVFSQARSELGAGFVRILGYFREDGVKSVAAIETAMRAPQRGRHGASGAYAEGRGPPIRGRAAGALAEKIETIARDCVENRDTPDEALQSVVELRPLFDKTLKMLERESNPLVERRPTAFGRRAL